MPTSFKTLLILIMTVLLLNSLTLYYHMNFLMDKERWVSHTFQAIAQIESLRFNLNSAENSAKTYLLTQNEKFRQDFYKFSGALSDKVESLRRLTADNSSQQTRIVTLEQLMNEKIATKQLTLQRFAEGGLPQVQSLLREDDVTARSARIEQKFAEMIAEEQRLLDLRSVATQRSLTIVNSIFSLILALDTIFVGLVYYFFNRYLTERRQAEIRLRSIFDKAAIGIEQIGPDGKIIDANPRLCKMLGYQADELVGRLIDKFIYPADQVRLREEHGRLFAGEIRGFHLEQRYLHREGRPIWVEMSSSAVSLNGSRPDYRLSMVQDISLRKVNEEEKKQLLEKSVISNRLKDEFLATISHELRTPLNIVLGHAELLELEEPHSEEFKSSLEAIQRNAALQAKMVDDILDVSNSTSGQLHLVLEPLEIKTILQTVIDSFRLALTAKKLDLQFKSSAAAVWVLGDGRRLHQVFWNLIGNAIKFTDECGQIIVRLQLGERGVMVRVSDNGQGIDPSFLPHVFEQFRQEDGSYTRRHGGIGLGLAIAKQIVDLHGGTIYAESAGSSYGASFTLFLPAIEAMATESAEAAESAHTNEEDFSTVQNKKLLSGRSILLIEDEKDARTLFVKALQMAGSTVKAASSAGEGFETFKTGAFDAVICDIGLPDEDGYSFIRKLRSYEQAEARKPILAIALTAFAQPIDKQKALDAGFHAHWAKPMTPTELTRCLADQFSH